MNNRFHASVLILGCIYLDETIFVNISFIVPNLCLVVIIGVKNKISNTDIK